MNPALPGGATQAEAALGDDAWSVGTRLGYAFVPYGRLQQGTDEAPNPNALGIDVHLGTLQVQAGAPTGTALDAQLPFGSLFTRSNGMRRADHGVGDLELRLRQSLRRWLRSPATSVALGAVVPTGPYVARSGAANLPPEASYLTLGRGVAWWIAEADVSVEPVSRLAVFAQLGARGPLSRTSDGFAWGTEARTTIGARATAIPGRLSFLLSSELLWRDGASEPDPFSMGRLTSANAGGWQWSLSPAAVVELPRGFTAIIGVRIPLAIDVVGNQLVPQTGGFVALSYTQRIDQPAPRISPSPGRITVVDYWAAWCAPCVEISSALETASSRWPDVSIIKIDATRWPAEGAPDLPQGARGLPAIELFDRSGHRTLLLGEDALRVVEAVDALRATVSVKGVRR